MEERFLKFPLVGTYPEDVGIILSVYCIDLFMVFEAFSVGGTNIIKFIGKSVRKAGRMNVKQITENSNSEIFKI